MQEGGDVAGRDVDEATPRGPTCPGDVGRDKASGSRNQRTPVPRRLVGQDIDTYGIELPGSKCLADSRFIEQRTSARVDEDGSRLHQGQALAIDEVAGLVGQRLTSSL